MADEQRVGHLIDELVAAIKHDMAAARAAGDASRWAVIGIRSRGDVLAKRIAQRIKFDHVGTLDITLYRDDLSEVAAQPVVRPTEIPFALDGLNVVLVDDVLMSGRSVRAALQLLMDLGRPRRVWLAVLVDRGQRELPIAPDHVALDLSGSARRRHIAPGLPGERHENPAHIAAGLPAVSASGDTKSANPAQVPGHMGNPAQVPGYMVGRGGGTLADAVKPDERVSVHLKPTDSEDAIIVTPRAAKGAGAA